ncbi:di-trans,poly-cis-decaprenylcistransferase [Candidatus Woesearchaeota archaeon]|nr:di-trans,poly-cis-decaprenylcistransferase [Candidatus Woesearchaeota archaeon]
MASKVPRHISIILDGNRRYAKKLGLQLWKGHDFGVKKLDELFGWCIELGIRELTLYCFSTENFTRAKKEIDYLFGLFWKEFEKMKQGRGIFKDKARVNVIGRTDMFSKKMQKAMLEAMKNTRKNRALLVNFALAYGGRQEITDSINKILNNKTRKNRRFLGHRKSKGFSSELKKINENMITKNLYLSSEPDLVIRPGGEVRTSNFLTWQSVYSEWVFVDKLWPEFTKEDLIKCIGEFNRRERRFGG